MRSTAGGGGSEDDIAEEDAIVVLYTLQTNKIERYLFVGGAKKWKEVSVRILPRTSQAFDVKTTHERHSSSRCGEILCLKCQQVRTFFNRRHTVLFIVPFISLDSQLAGNKSSHLDARHNKISKIVSFYIWWDLITTYNLTMKNEENICSILFFVSTLNQSETSLQTVPYFFWM